MTKIYWRKLGLLILTITICVMLTTCGVTNRLNPFPDDKHLSNTPKLAENFNISFYNTNNLLVDNETQFFTLFQNDKPIVLNLWAGLCPPCRAEMPEMEEVYKEYSESIILFGLDLGPFMGLGSENDGQTLVGDLGITYPTGTTDNSDVIHTYKVLGLPTTFFINSNREITRTWTGIIHKEKLVELIEDLMESN